MDSNRRKYYSPSSHFESTITRYIQNWFSWEDKQRSIMSSNHISTIDAYKRILQELSSIEDRFYHDFDVRRYKKQPTGYDWKTFAVPQIMNIMDLIYTKQQYCQSYDEELKTVDDYHSEPDEQLDRCKLYTPAIAKIRIRCANRIWKEWSDERLWGPRVGVILISTKEMGAEKVLLVSHIKNNVWYYGFPKGKPNLGETIREGAFREFKEETGIYELILSLQISEKKGTVITKYPHIGPIHRRRNRAHHYAMTTTSTQFTSFRPQAEEIDDVEWHSIYTLPCCDHCKIQRTYRFEHDAEISINYHMVTLRDINGENTSILDMLAYIDATNGNRNAYNKYRDTHRECGNNLS